MREFSLFVIFLTIFNYQNINSTNLPSGGICHRTDKEISYVSNEVIMTKMGLKAQLYCCIINSDFIGWVFLDTKIEQNSKYTLLFDRNVGAQVLTINNMQESDAGTYFCRINSLNRELRDFPVLVNIKAELSNQATKFYVEISKTERLQLNVIGIPFPTVAFYRADNEKALVENFQSRKAARYGRYEITTDGDLIIHTVVQSDTGRYIIRLNQGATYVPDDYVIEIYAGARPFVAYMPKSIYNFTLGQKEILPARFSGNMLNIYWKFTSDILGERSNRISGDTDAHYFVSVDGSLSVINVDTTDSGRYIGVCQNPWGEVQVSTVVERTIRAAQIIILNNQVATVNGNATFQVTVAGSPPPYISWWRNGVQIKGKRISETISILHLIYITRNDGGIYTCIADNGASENGVRTYFAMNTTLFVDGFPIMDLKKSSKIVVVTENRKIITLRCVVNGYPYADIKFVKQNLTFTPNSVSVSQKNIDRLEALLKLTIESQSQVGNYTCIATNTLGTSTLDIMVKYMDIPLPPRNVHILELDTTSVRIGWDISASQALRDTYSFLATIWDNNHVFTQSIQIFEEYAIFTALTRGKKYYFSVRASNIAGWSLPSNTIIFNTPNVGRPSAPLVLNRQIFLPTSDFRLYWTGPMDNGGDSIITYTVRKCIWNIERITFDMDCETFRGVRSNEIYFNGLIAFQLYDFYVSAVNSIQNSEEARFQVFSGPNSFIGTPGGTSPEVITILILLFTILFILLMDILLFLCLRTGVLYWLITCCLFKKSRIEEEQIPLRRDSMGPIKTITETVPMNTEFSKIYQKDTERIENNNYLEVEDHMYQEICEDNVRKYNPIIISNERQKTLENKNSPENVQYSIAEDRQKSGRENYNMGFPLNKAALSENRNTQGNRYNKESSMNINTYDRDKGGEKIRLLQGEERGGKTNLKPSKYSNTISTKNNAEEIKFGERDYPVRTFTLTPEELQNKAKILTKNINIPSNEGKGTIVNFDSMSKKNLPKITRQTNLEPKNTGQANKDKKFKVANEEKNDEKYNVMAASAAEDKIEVIKKLNIKNDINKKEDNFEAKFDGADMVI